jgi:hypothetical protein
MRIWCGAMPVPRSRAVSTLRKRGFQVFHAHVDRHIERRMPAQQRAQFGQHDIEHLVGDLLDQPRVLGHRNEQVRPHQPPVAAPAHQRLDAHAMVVDERHDGLVVHGHFVPPHGAAQFAFQAEAARGASPDQDAQRHAGGQAHDQAAHQQRLPVGQQRRARPPPRPAASCATCAARWPIVVLRGVVARPVGVVRIGALQPRRLAPCVAAKMRPASVCTTASWRDARSTTSTKICGSSPT